MQPAPMAVQRDGGLAPGGAHNKVDPKVDLQGRLWKLPVSERSRGGRKNSRLHGKHAKLAHDAASFSPLAICQGLAELLPLLAGERLRL